MVDLYATSYKSFFEFNPFGKSSTSSNPYSLNTISPNSLSFMEESFFWTLKRFTIFNTLPSLDRENAFRFKSNKINPIDDNPLLLKRNWLNLYLTASQTKSWAALSSPSTSHTTLTELNQNPNLNASSYSYGTLRSFDSFNLDFTENIVLAFFKPAVNNNTYPYYSFTCQHTNSSSPSILEKLN